MNGKVANFNLTIAKMDNFLSLHTWMELAFKDLVAKISTGNASTLTLVPKCI